MVADAMQEMDTMAEVVDLRTKVTGVNEGAEGGGGGRGGRYKDGGKGNYFSNNSSRLCNLCQTSGRLAANCPHTKEFADS